MPHDAEPSSSSGTPALNEKLHWIESSLPMQEPWELLVSTMLPMNQRLPVPVVLMQSGPYLALGDEFKKNAPNVYLHHGFAYVVAKLSAPRNVMADGIFGEQWRASGRVLLDWLGEQPWCDGRVFLSGWSACGNIAYATLAVANEAQRPKHRATVAAVVPVCSFSRIHPTVFQWGNGLSIELALRFLWLAELGTRPEFGGISWAVGQFRFFLTKNWRLLHDTASLRPLTGADEAMWGRKNNLLQTAVANRDAEDPFWCDGVDARDAQCDIKALGERCPPMHFISGWHDFFSETNTE